MHKGYHTFLSIAAKTFAVTPLTLCPSASHRHLCIWGSLVTFVIFNCLYCSIPGVFGTQTSAGIYWVSHFGSRGGKKQKRSYRFAASTNTPSSPHLHNRSFSSCGAAALSGCVASFPLSSPFFLITSSGMSQLQPTSLGAVRPRLPTITLTLPRVIRRLWRRFFRPTTVHKLQAMEWRGVTAPLGIFSCGPCVLRYVLRSRGGRCVGAFAPPLLPSTLAHGPHLSPTQASDTGAAGA